MKKLKLFGDFPETLYIVHHEDDESGEGYFLVFDDEVEAVEDANENDSEVAEYTIEGHQAARVDKTVRYV
jgi:hypothetical protein